MLVFVISKEGLPLMPCKPATARHLLKKGSAKVVKRTPFTIQLNFECENKVQDVVLGNVYIGKQTRRNNRAIQLNRKGFKPSVRKQRYGYQPNDIVKFAGILYFVKGVQSLGKQIKLAGLKNPVRTESVELVKYGKGLQFSY